MTLVVIGPVTHDIIRIGGRQSHKVGGATYYQSFVFEEFYRDYVAFVNGSDESILDEFPDKSKVRLIKKDNTHFFINNYPNPDDLDLRQQLSNFSDIPIFKSDLEEILPPDIDAFVINPLNRFDFPADTVEYLKTFGVPIFMSVQGFLRTPNVKVNDSYTIELNNFESLGSILRGVTAIFLDEGEANIIGTDCDVDEMVITNGSHGSRILCDGEIKISAVKCDNVVDTTGCGDTFMAAYICEKLSSKSSKRAGDFASEIASVKILNSGPYNIRK